MKFVIGSQKEDHTEVLPKHQQVTITLETQKEIDQLYAMLNYVPIVEAAGLRDGDWIPMRDSLSKSSSYLTWHGKLCKMTKE